MLRDFLWGINNWSMILIQIANIRAMYWITRFKEGGIIYSSSDMNLSSGLSGLFIFRPM